MVDLCQYSGALGEPGEGVHRPRVGGLAAVDLLITAGASFAISRAGGWPVLVVFIILMVLAVVAHEVFCVNTRLNAALFGREYCPAGAEK